MLFLTVKNEDKAKYRQGVNWHVVNGWQVAQPPFAVRPGGFSRQNQAIGVPKLALPPMVISSRHPAAEMGC
jgi:hypothetical protein